MTAVNGCRSSNLPMIAVILTLIICGAAATGGLVFLLRSFANKSEKGSSGDTDEQEKVIKKVDEQIEIGLSYLAEMLPLSEALEKEKVIAGVRGELAVESKKLADLDAQLSKLQRAVEDAEAAHNELKKGDVSLEYVSKLMSRTVYELIAGKTSASTAQSSAPHGASTSKVKSSGLPAVLCASRLPVVAIASGL